MSRSLSRGTPVDTLAATPGGACAGTGPRYSCSGFSDAYVVSSTSKCFLTSAGGTSAAIVPFSTRTRAQCSRTVGCEATVW